MGFYIEYEFEINGVKRDMCYYYLSHNTNTFVFHGLITHILNNKKTLYTAFVDFTKAFDYLVRDVIWYKLIKYGVRGKNVGCY